MGFIISIVVLSFFLALSIILIFSLLWDKKYLLNKKVALRKDIRNLKQERQEYQCVVRQYDGLVPDDAKKDIRARFRKIVL